MMRKPILQPPPPPLPGKKYFVTVSQSVSHVNIFMPIHPQGFTVHGNYTLFIRQISFGFNRLQSIY